MLTPPVQQQNGPAPDMSSSQPSLDPAVHFFSRNALAIVQGGQSACVEEFVRQSQHVEPGWDHAFAHQQAGHGLTLAAHDGMVFCHHDQTARLADLGQDRSFVQRTGLCAVETLLS
jgi:hypothetical protein